MAYTLTEMEHQVEVQGSDPGRVGPVQRKIEKLGNDDAVALRVPVGLDHALGACSQYLREVRGHEELIAVFGTRTGTIEHPLSRYERLHRVVGNANTVEITPKLRFAITEHLDEPRNVVLLLHNHPSPNRPEGLLKQLFVPRPLPSFRDRRSLHALEPDRFLKVLRGGEVGVRCFVVQNGRLIEFVWPDWLTLYKEMAGAAKAIGINVSHPADVQERPDLVEAYLQAASRLLRDYAAGKRHAQG